MSKTITKLAVACAAAALTFGVVTPANATTAEATIIDGITKSEFIAAADEFGWATAAEEAWGDLDAMSEIPFGSTLEKAPVRIEAGAKTLSVTAAAARRTLSGTCTKTVKNYIGNNIMVLKVSKSWQTDGSRVWPLSSSYTTEEAWGWYFDGLVGSQQYYATNFPNNFMHISKYQAKFTHFMPPPESRSIWASVNGHTTNYGCSSS